MRLWITNNGGNKSRLRSRAVRMTPSPPAVAPTGCPETRYAHDNSSIQYFFLLMMCQASDWSSVWSDSLHNIRVALLYKLLRSKDLRRSVVLASHAGRASIPSQVLSEHFSGLSSSSDPLPHGVKARKRRGNVQNYVRTNTTGKPSHPLTRCEGPQMRCVEGKTVASHGTRDCKPIPPIGATTTPRVTSMGMYDGQTLMRPCVAMCRSANTVSLVVNEDVFV